MMSRGRTWVGGVIELRKPALVLVQAHVGVSIKIGARRSRKHTGPGIASEDRTRLRGHQGSGTQFGASIEHGAALIRN